MVGVRDQLKSGKLLAQPFFDGDGHFVFLRSGPAKNQYILMDSLSGKPSRKVRIMIWSLLNSDDNDITIFLPSCPMQSPTSMNCCVYAAAFFVDTIMGLSFDNADYGNELSFRKNWLKSIIERGCIFPTPRVATPLGQAKTARLPNENIVITKALIGEYRLAEKLPVIPGCDDPSISAGENPFLDLTNL
jgi:hypothetical protein